MVFLRNICINTLHKGDDDDDDDDDDDNNNNNRLLKVQHLKLQVECTNSINLTMSVTVMLFCILWTPSQEQS